MGASSSLFTQSKIPSGSRLGMHYFPDTLHYRDADLQNWLPELRDLGVGWLVLRSELDRAIPEGFVRGLKQAGIEPIIQFPLTLERAPESKDLGTLLNVYARWGIRYVFFFERPNARSAWPAASWFQQDLVERFLDRFLPAASLALQAGMVPVFPPLEPGGSYWDTAFLRSALEAMQRRRQEEVLQNLVLSAYAWTGGNPLDWGAGGPERWPEARPYAAPPDSHDQRGFRIYDWYTAIARSVLHRACPIILLQAGLPGDPQSVNPAELSSKAYQGSIQAVCRLMEGDTVEDPLLAGNTLEPVSSSVIACCLWTLSAGEDSPYAAQAWFTEDGRRSGLARAVLADRRERLERSIQAANGGQKKSAVEFGYPIRHYLLLPGREGGVADWYLEVIRPFVKKHHPTVGFSLDEASHAARVTVIGPAQNYPEDALTRLQQAGCWVEQIRGNGTDIASQLAER